MSTARGRQTGSCISAPMPAGAKPGKPGTEPRSFCFLFFENKLIPPIWRQHEKSRLLFTEIDEVTATESTIDKRLSNHTHTSVVTSDTFVCESIKRYYIRKYKSAEAVAGTDCNSEVLVVHSNLK